MFLLFFLIGLFIVIMCFENSRNIFFALILGITQLGIVVVVITLIGFIAFATLVFGVNFLVN